MPELTTLTAPVLRDRTGQVSAVRLRLFPESHMRMWANVNEQGYACGLRKSPLLCRAKQLRHTYPSPLAAVVAIRRGIRGGIMRRTVTGIVLAAALLTPASSMAASRNNAMPTLLSWWDSVVACADRIVLPARDLSAGKRSPRSRHLGRGGAPMEKSSTTIDANGST
jgi:hypothetical protein